MSSEELKNREENNFGYDDGSGWYNRTQSSNKDKNKKHENHNTKSVTDEQKSLGYKAMAKKSKKSGMKKKAAFGGIGLTAIFAAVALNLFLSLGGGGLMLNLDRLYEAYRLQNINRQFARRVAHISLSDSLAGASGPRPTTGLSAANASMFQRMGRWSPNSAMRNLGASGIEFNFERNRLGRNRLVSVTDRNTGRTINRSNLRPSEFTRQVTDLVDVNMTEMGKNRFYRRQTANFVRQNTGIRLSKFREFLTRGSQEMSASERRRLLMAERLDDMTAGRSPRRSRIATIDEGAQEQRRRLQEDGRLSDNWSENTTLNRRRQMLTRMGNVSDANLVLTMGCIANDISGQTLNVIENRINGPLRAYADFRTKNDQIRAGDVTDAAIAAETEYWAGAHQSAAIQRATGTPHENIPNRTKLTEIEYPFTLFGMQISTVQRLAFIVNTATNPLGALQSFLGFSNQDDFDFEEIPTPNIDNIQSSISNDILGEDEDGEFSVGSEATIGQVIDNADENSRVAKMGLCDVLLHPAGQAAIGVGELAITIASLGGVRAASAALTSSWRVGARIAAGSSISYLIYFRVIPAYIDNLNGIDSMPLPGEGPRNGNKIDVGALLLKNSIAASSGGTILSTETAMEQQRESIARFREHERSKGALYAYLSPNNPLSLTSRLAYSMHSINLRTIGPSILNVFSSTLQPSRLIPRVSASNNYPPEEEFYGMQDSQFGWENSHIDGTDERFDFINNTVYVENNFDELNEKYAGCFNTSMLAYATGNYPDECDTTDAMRYGIYYLDCISIDQVESTGPDGSYESTTCNYIISNIN